MIVTLRPCPFCGGPATPESDEATGDVFVFCEDPKSACAAAPMSGPHASLGSAVDSWNHRFDPLGSMSRKSGDTTWQRDDYGQFTQIQPS